MSILGKLFGKKDKIKEGTVEAMVSSTLQDLLDRTQVELSFEVKVNRGRDGAEDEVRVELFGDDDPPAICDIHDEGSTHAKDKDDAAAQKDSAEAAATMRSSGGFQKVKCGLV